MIRPITSNYINNLKTPNEQNSGPDEFTGEAYQTLKEKISTYPSQTIFRN